MTLADPHRAHTALVRALDERGLLPPPWREIWERTPRHRFIPGRIWKQGAKRCEPVTTDADWWRLVASDQPVVTQVDDGQEGGPGIATSSNSMPSMVARMLELLEVQDGVSVLEIGTATGHVAALLSARLGDRHVTSIEIDPTLAAVAEKNLAALGFAPTLVVADGEQGYPAGGPWDRLIATCALRHVPYALVEQVAAGGIIVAPLIREFLSGALVQLTVHSDGTARGRFRGSASYMPMRSHRAAGRPPVDTSTPRSRWATLDPSTVLTLPFALYAGARLPGVSLIQGEADGAVRVWLQDGKGSAAVADAEAVTEFGQRDLWSEVERIHHDFAELGDVVVSDFGLTVSPHGQHLWLGAPAEVISPDHEPVRR
ncbi:methyltransferase domain-containing protein [Streptomyces demainii]|uniref:Protein-L-isoaspartate O-methyltransferase n=1 Tax=Streptomyces demainii TaxID=588122 RepID=A0ABT9L726_9ACTN|nr:methyltransferase domain-containing protein [Streptomyces demainii]MDP9616493.1 protein-L-isoaspartate(D-aspartate) O-methyltransferase [Streptomyces demainii]